jgi:hypothetical protein
MSSERRNEKNKGLSKKVGKKQKFILFLITAGLPTLAAVLALLILIRPRYVWYVEEGLEALWDRVLASADPPWGFKPGIVSLKPGEAAPDGSGGFLITTHRAKSAGPVKVYPRLSFNLEYEGAHVLALDPWMVFRQHIFPSLSLRMIERGQEGDAGRLLIPGRDPASVRAWTARLVQERPGVFPEDRTVWDRTAAGLMSGGLFSRSSAAFNWQDVWFYLLGDEPAWVYAPLSRIRELPHYRAGVLEAAVFPENSSAIGLQTRILWAIPLGTEREKKGLERSLRWLKSGEVQTFIADTLGWLPADPKGKPYDPLAMTARLAWLTCSYVWEDGEL